MKSDKERIIETKELPIVSFCAYCDKPIYIKDEYAEVQYFDDVRKKHINKKNLKSGYAHKHCIIEKEAEVKELREKSRKSNQFILALSVVIGFVIALAMILILVFANVTPLVFSILIPLGIGYLIAAELFCLLSDHRVSLLYQKIFLKLLNLPKYIATSDDSIFLRIVVLIVMVPLDFVLLIITFVLSTIISVVMFPILLIKKEYL